jgi:RNA-binding protein YhbY
MNLFNEVYIFIKETSKYESLVSDLIVGVLLVFIFFLYREFISPLVNISGKWYVRTTTKETVRNPFKNMVLEYVVIVLQNGQNLEGSTEKVYEHSIEGEIKYIGKNRVQGIFKGYIEKNYLKKNIIKIQVTEKGQERESTIYYELNKNCGSALTGVFDSTAGDSKGTTIWQRRPFV